MAKVNMTAIKVAVAKDRSRVMERAAKERAQEVFEDAVIGLQVAFEDHPVTQEIAGGINATNLSRTLSAGDDYAPKNLTAFIGFDGKSDPLEPIRDSLSPDDPAGPKLRYGGKEIRDNNARFKFTISTPDKQAIYKRTKGLIPWAKGWSWAQKVETHIPGFAHFLARYMGYPSRSGGGIQAKDTAGNLKEIRPGAEYSAPEGGYLTGLFTDFLNQVRAYRKGGLKRRFK